MKAGHFLGSEMMWFEELIGFAETTPAEVRETLAHAEWLRQGDGDGPTAGRESTLRQVVTEYRNLREGSPVRIEPPSVLYRIGQEKFEEFRELVKGSALSHARSVVEDFLNDPLESRIAEVTDTRLELTMITEKQVLIRVKEKPDPSR